MASAQDCIESQHIGILSPQLERKSSVQISKDDLQRCLRQINENVQRSRKLKERSQGMVNCPLCLEQRVCTDKQRDRNRKVDWGQGMKNLNARLWDLFSRQGTH